MIKARLFISMLFLAAAIALHAQPIEVNGKVNDEGGISLPGVTVLISGTNRGTVTDLDGLYSIQAQPNDVLEFSFIGYNKQVIPVNNQRVIDVTMRVDFTQLDEVIVIGYGTVRKSDLTGSVSSLREGDFNPGANTSLSEMILGRSPGVQVVQASAEPGGGMSIRVRGAGSISAGSDPLYVIDGLPIDNSQVITITGAGVPGMRAPRNPLSRINPADIVSIEILKDASSTAIYGARGANGVILVTTKKGTPGALRVNYSGYTGIQSPTSKINLLSPENYMKVLNDILDDGGGNPEERVLGIQGVGTDWQDELTRDAAINSHSVSFSGGNESTNYYASLNYLKQNGIVINNGMDRYDLRLNLDHKIADRFHMGMNLTTSYTYDDFIAYGYAINEQAGALYAAQYFDPTLTVFDDNGAYQISPYITVDNPLALAHGIERFAHTYRNMGSFFSEYFILPEWSVKLNLGGDIQNTRQDSYNSPLTETGRSFNGQASIITGAMTNYLIEATTHYNKEFSDNHRINLVAGVSRQRFITNRFNGEAENFASHIMKTNSMQVADNSLYTMSTNKFSNALVSYIGRANYALMNKYLFTTTYRIDGSSRFGDNNRFGYFPSFAFAWKMNEEHFIKDLELFSQLSARLSWGRTGNQDIGNYNAQTTFTTGGNAQFDGNLYTTFQPGRIPNPELKWETTEQFNVGLDYGFLRDRVFGSLDYFVKNTYDMLISLPVPASTGFGSMLQNVGSIRNNGFEFMVSSRNLVGQFKWNSSLNFTTMKNEVIDIGGLSEIIHIGAGWSNQIAIIRVGEPLNSFYGYKILGVWQEGDDFSVTNDNVRPGDQKYADMNDDNVVNANDRVILGNSFPDFVWGLSNVFTFKGFELSVFIEGVHGVEMFNNNLVDTYFPINFRRNKYSEPYLNRWTPESPSNVYPSFVRPNAQGNKAVNSYTVEDASYIKIRNVRVGYDIPVRRINFIQHANVYISGQNLVTFTNYSGLDPSTNSNMNPSVKIDYNSYPVARAFLLGVDITF